MATRSRVRAPPPPPPGPPAAGVQALAGRPYWCHVGTENGSFLAAHRRLLAEGVRNNKFMLALFDEGLHGVDPLAEDLPDETRGRVLAEILRNPWYFWREVVRIPVPGGTVMFELHLGNLFLLWSMVANINCFLLLPRQTYKTVSACCFYLWAYGFGCTNSHILFFNKELIDSKNNLKRLKGVFDELPDWLRRGVLTDSVEDRFNIDYISSGHRGNRIDAKPAGKDMDHADRLGDFVTIV